MLDCLLSHCSSPLSVTKLQSPCSACLPSDTLRFVTGHLLRTCLEGKLVPICFLLLLFSCSLLLNSSVQPTLREKWESWDLLLSLCSLPPNLLLQEVSPSPVGCGTQGFKLCELFHVNTFDSNKLLHVIATFEWEN